MKSRIIKNSLKFIGKALILGALVFSYCPTQVISAKAEDDDLNFALTEADIKQLNLNDSEAAELRQFFDALNNLSPEEKQELKDLGEKTEQKMKSDKYKQYNFDPTNFDDLVKFMEMEEKEAQEEAKKKKGDLEEVSVKPSAKVKETKKPELVTVTSPKEILPLLKDIERKTESLVVKVKNREALKEKLSKLHLEMAEFRYFIKVLQAPDLVLLVGSKDFARLHKNLEKLHKALASHEPAIIARSTKIDVDDPYDMLGVEYSATTDQIKRAYNEKKATQSPESIAKTLTSKKMSERDRKKALKEARLSWGFIEDAYQTLIDPKERALVRKELKNKIEEEARHDRTSRAAFDKVYNALTTAFYPDAILTDIKDLLEKHKPAELEAAQKQLEKEKRAAEEMKKKQAVRIETTPTRPPAEQDYGEFYRKFASEPRPYYPAPTPTGAPAYQPGEKEEMPKPAGPGAKKGDGKKDDKKGDKKDDKKEDKKESKEDKKKRKATEAKDLGKAISQIDALEGWFKKMAETKGMIEVPAPKKAAPAEAKDDEEEKEEEETKSIPLAEVLRNVSRDLTVGVRGAEGPSDAAKQLRSYFEKHNFKDQLKYFKELAPGIKGAKPAKQLQENICKEWEARIWKPFGEKFIKKWHTDIFGILSIPKQAGRIQPTKAQLYKIKPLDVTMQDLFKKEVKAPTATKPGAKKSAKDGDDDGKPKGLDLGEIADTLNKMYLYSENINAACAKKPGAPAAKKDKDGDKDKKKS